MHLLHAILILSITPSSHGQQLGADIDGKGILMRRSASKHINWKAIIVEVEAQKKLAEEKTEPAKVAHNRAEHARIGGATPDDSDDQNLVEGEAKAVVDATAKAAKSALDAKPKAAVDTKTKAAADATAAYRKRLLGAVTAKADGCSGGLDYNACIREGCGYSRPTQKCQSCESLSETECNLDSLYGCIHTKAGCLPKLLVSFGGKSHGTKSSGMVLRPEAVHSDICRSGKCKGCNSISGCWHGAGASELRVAVPPGTVGTQTVRSARVWLSCGVNSGEQYKVKFQKVDNSRVAVLVDGKKQKMVDVRNSNGKFKTVKLDIPSDGKDHVVVIEHNVLDMQQGSFAQIRFWAQMQPWVDQCLSRKVCLAELGDGSGASFEIRNSNHRQRECLYGRPAAEDKEKCGKWTRCLGRGEAKVPGQLLKAMLNVALGTNGGQLSQTETRASSDGKCIDPYTADPEAWECECMEELETTCGHKDDMEKCLKKIMCKIPSICCAWKQDNCPDVQCQPELLSLMDARGTDNEAGASINSLDSTTLGKCAA